MLLCKNDTVTLILLQSRVKPNNCKRFALILASTQSLIDVRTKHICLSD